MNQWLATAFCDTCKVEVRKHHMARHRLSKGHIARVGASYRIKRSDEDFARFLRSVTPADFSATETAIYRNRKDQT